MIAATPPFRWPERPYKGLLPYSYADAPLFAGRSREISQCASALLRSEISVFLLHGHSGCGKTSFLEAGLVPHLEQLSNVNAPPYVAASKRSRLVPVGAGRGLIVRAGQRPYEALAHTVYDLINHLQRGGLAKNAYLKRARGGASSVRAFVEDTRASELRLFKSLGSVSAAIPGKLLLIIDQAENIFVTANREDASDRQRYFRLLSLISLTPIDVKIVISIRTDFKALLDDALRQVRFDSTKLGTYYLDAMTKEGMIAAIRHPTLPAQLEVMGYTLPPPRRQYRFQFDIDVPEMIVDDLTRFRVGESRHAVLPLLQVICDRLYSRARADLPPLTRRNATITQNDYRGSGAAGAQITSHIEDAIIDFFLRSRRHSDVNYAEQADRWRIAMLGLANTRDGAPIARLSVSEADLLDRAGRYGCHGGVKMLRWLASEHHYILELVRGVPRSRHWKLRHDQLAISLVGWSSVTTTTIAEARHDRNSVVAAAEVSARQLYGSDPPSPRAFYTLNDLIWDHQLPLYAAAKGFAARLGLDIHADPRHDLSKNRQQITYADFLARPRRDGLPRLAVLPVELFPNLADAPWVCVGIPNTYSGYAIMGPEREDVLPLRAADPLSVDEVRQRLARLADAVTAEARIFAFERSSDEFVKTVLRGAGHSQQNVRVIVANGHRRNVTRDAMFTALVERTADFALGTAPSRALAEQAGFVVYADFDTVRDAAPSVADALRRLAMHELFVTDVDPSDTPTIMRLVSLMFYTVAYIRARPDEFVEYIFNNRLEAGKHAQRLRRVFIRRAVDTCYRYLPFEQYAFEYLGPLAAVQLTDRSDRGAITVLGKFLELRARCDELLIALGATPLPSVLADAFERARRHYEIFNFYDAYATLRQIVSVYR